MICVTVSVSGCFGQKIPVQTEPLFCDVAEVRRFSQAEIDWRVDHAPWNLRKDLAQNDFGRANCPPEWADVGA